MNIGIKLCYSTSTYGEHFIIIEETVKDPEPHEATDELGQEKIFLGWMCRRTAIHRSGNVTMFVYVSSTERPKKLIAGSYTSFSPITVIIEMCF
jgi:hypothetical protein